MVSSGQTVDSEADIQSTLALLQGYGDAGELAGCQRTLSLGDDVERIFRYADLLGVDTCQEGESHIVGVAGRVAGDVVRFDKGAFEEFPPKRLKIISKIGFGLIDLVLFEKWGVVVPIRWLRQVIAHYAYGVEENHVRLLVQVLLDHFEHALHEEVVGIHKCHPISLRMGQSEISRTACAATL